MPEIKIISTRNQLEMTYNVYVYYTHTTSNSKKDFFIAVAFVANVIWEVNAHITKAPLFHGWLLQNIGVLYSKIHAIISYLLLFPLIFVRVYEHVLRYSALRCCLFFHACSVILCNTCALQSQCDAVRFAFSVVCGREHFGVYVCDTPSNLVYPIRITAILYSNGTAISLAI